MVPQQATPPRSGFVQPGVREGRRKSAAPLNFTLAAMNYETTLTYSEPLLRHAVFAFWRRTVGVGFLAALLLTGVSLVSLLARGEVSWIVGVLGTVFVFGILFVVALYFIHYRNSLAKFRDMGSPNAKFSVNDSSFTVSSGTGTATLQWSVVKELDRKSVV